MSIRAFLPAALIGGVVSAGVVVGVLAATDNLGGDDSGSGTTATITAAASRGPSAPPVGALYRQVSRGVLRIDARPPGTPLPSGSPREDDGVATGSGFVIDDNGDIVTNDHVVAGGSVLTVQPGEGAKRIRARVVGRNPSDDLALIRVSAAAARKLTPLALGDSKDVKVGDEAVAIGGPFGLQRTLTVGVVSATGREIRSPNGDQIKDVLQTDAAINPGSSGSPLLDARGRVIGVNSQARGTGIGFAVSVATLKSDLPKLRRGERPARQAFLGVTLGAGGRVADAEPGGPGARAGLRAGDRIVAIGAKSTADSNAVVSAIRAHKPGETVTVRVQRGTKRLTLRVRLGER